ncbi:hypothetical protein ACIRU8_14550 [Streptomyces sp. NPDC101175]|uniref:hypothetical protein n=1 Tax=Streptomyces sp. NPDC101175 TaxID=3366123 RepID=UPI0038389AD6
MARIETVEEFAREATHSQAGAFAAACAERAVAILFWVVSADGRTVDLDNYKSALDSLWVPERAGPDEIDEKREKILGMQELVVGDEASGVHAFAYQGAVALYTALEVCVREKERVLLDCSSALRNYAFRLGRRCGVDLLTGEDELQLRDVADLSAVAGDKGVSMSLRRRSAAEGRRWLALATDRFG